MYYIYSLNRIFIDHNLKITVTKNLNDKKRE